MAGNYGSWRSSPLPSNWLALRRFVLARDMNACMWGKLPGESESGEVGNCRNPGTEVDHMGGNANHDPAALRAICTYHHRKRTSAQANAARRAALESRGGYFRSVRKPKPHPGLRD